MLPTKPSMIDGNTQAISVAFQHGGFSNLVYLLASTKKQNCIRNKIGTSKQILLFLSFQSMSRLSPEYPMIDFIVAKMTREKTGPPGPAKSKKHLFGHIQRSVRRRLKFEDTYIAV